VADDRNQNPANSNETGGRESQRRPGENQHTQGSSPQSRTDGQQSEQGQQGSNNSMGQNQQQQELSGFDQGNFGQGQGPDGSQGGAGNHSSQTATNADSESEEDTGSNDHQPDDGERPERQIEEFEKGTDEYRQNRQDEVNPDIDGDDRDGDTEGPTTADGSSIPSSSDDQANATSGSTSN